MAYKGQSNFGKPEQFIWYPIILGSFKQLRPGWGIEKLFDGKTFHLPQPLHKHVDYFLHHTLKNAENFQSTPQL